MFICKILVDEMYYQLVIVLNYMSNYMVVEMRQCGITFGLLCIYVHDPKLVDNITKLFRDMSMSLHKNDPRRRSYTPNCIAYWF